MSRALPPLPKSTYPVQRAAILAGLTPMQRAFIEDPARYKLARATRRAGKTYADAAYMVLECLDAPNTPVLYAGLTRDSAKAAVWQILLDMLVANNIEHVSHPSALHVTFPNGSQITLFGCDTENARNRLRGRRFKLVVFDETGFYSALDPLVYAILPSLADLRGTLVMTSSPGELLQGFFYEADQGKFKDKWSRYFWTIHDNPHFQQPATNPIYKTMAEEELATVLEFQFQGKADHPGYQREWLGQWVSDHTSLVYPCTDINFIDAPEKLQMQEHAIGLCITPFVCAAVVARYSAYSRTFDIIHAKEYNDLTVDAFATEIDVLIERYKAEQVVAHTGPFSRHIVSEIKRRYRFPVVAMDDKDTTFHQAVFANDLRMGHIRVVRSLPIIERYARIVKDSSGDEIEGQSNSAPNAALALYRRIYTVTLQSVEAPLTEEDRHIAQLERSRFPDPEEEFENSWINQRG